MATPKDNKDKNTKPQGVKKTTPNKKTTTISTDSSVMSKAKSKLQKEAAANKKSSTKPKTSKPRTPSKKNPSTKPISNKTKNESKVKDNTGHKEVVVRSRKDVRGIPKAKLTVFNQVSSSSDKLSEKPTPTKTSMEKETRQEEKVEKSEKPKKVEKPKKEALQKKEQVKKSVKAKKEVSTSKTIASKQGVRVPVKRATLSQSKSSTTSKKTFVKPPTKPVTKKTLKSKKASLKNAQAKKIPTKKTQQAKKKVPPKKAPIKKAPVKKRFVSKSKVLVLAFFIGFLFLLIFLVTRIIENNEILDQIKNSNTLNKIQAASIVEPKLANESESKYIYIGDSIKDLSSLNKTVENISSDSLESDISVINIEDDSLSGDYIKLTIDSGLSANSIASLLEENNVCDKDLFIEYVVENNLETNLRSGSYLIKKNSSIKEIVNSIVETDFTTFTIYPASTIDQVDLLLTNRKLIKSGEFVKACTDICKQKGLSFVEGWFTPATYKVTKSFDVNLLASAMIDDTFKLLSPYLKDIAKSGYSINDIIIIASLIQGETQDTSQMPIISSVIHNRLKKDMPLGIDATTRYELGDWTSPLTQEVLDKETPYNTRRKKGLPPSGICLSSKSAIVSAIYPENSDYLYYIHDFDGEMIPSLNYKEHLKNIEKRDKKKQ